ncbi:hypothetical protein DAI22_12g161000 [Oryza sativa Japonica Group]|nr:hypothetical protein DAI22_12g161000 [Oryza sativa Japonica Group]
MQNTTSSSLVERSLMIIWWINPRYSANGSPHTTDIFQSYIYSPGKNKIMEFPSHVLKVHRTHSTKKSREMNFTFA